MSPDSQRLLAFLSEARSYPHHPQTVTMVQTHASWVFIAPPFVWKVKKPVNLGFLDFSTLELRHADCEREVALNRRLADDVYLGIEPIREHQGALTFGDEGTVVEWAVKMRLLDERYFLSHRLATKEGVTTADLDRVVEKLRVFYHNQPPPPNQELWTTNVRLRRSIDGNFDALRDFIGRGVPSILCEAVRRFADVFFAQHEDLLQSRMDRGWVRDCHGDLHTEHIHLTPDAVTIYDCIEFNTRFRYIDVACDIAFLAMDLDFNGRPDLARHVVDRFSVLLCDEGMKPLMDFYKCYRACVRGKVEMMHGAAETASPREREESVAKARRYLRLALRYAIAGSAPCAWVFMGRVASGKSSLATALSAVTGWDVLSSDVVRKELAGVPLHHRGGDDERAALYAPEMTTRTYKDLGRRALGVLRHGGNVIIDATFSSRARRDDLRRLLRDEGFGARWMEVRAGEAVMRGRLAARGDSGGSVSDARLGDYDTLNVAYESPDELSREEFMSVESGSQADETLRGLMLTLAERQGGKSTAQAGC